MPDVGSLLIKAYEQRNLPKDKQDYDLMDKASHDFAAYICIDIIRKILFKFYIYIYLLFLKEFSMFVNNILSSLVVNCTNEKISLQALKQLHRLATIDLYREALGNTLSDVINNYIYCHSKK
ncbi:unnamed protein product [Rotaria sordida]|uniref:Uncharacterized protein n=1 Tax=Rotaria sordida TaxID=392033 RepID=A0A815AS79_9BILA|nr:unnamed protein product [Rotaria sordida]